MLPSIGQKCLVRNYRSAGAIGIVTEVTKTTYKIKYVDHADQTDTFKLSNNKRWGSDEYSNLHCLLSVLEGYDSFEQMVDERKNKIAAEELRNKALYFCRDFKKWDSLTTEQLTQIGDIIRSSETKGN